MVCVFMGNSCGHKFLYGSLLKGVFRLQVGRVLYISMHVIALLIEHVGM